MENPSNPLRHQDIVEAATFQDYLKEKMKKPSECKRKDENCFN